MGERIALVVDDAPANRDFLERLLGGAAFTVVGASSGSKALSALEAVEDLVLAVVDMKLPDMTGLQLAAELRRRFPQACLVIATMLDDRSMMVEALQQGCNIFLVKPHGFMDLFQRLKTEGVDAIKNGPFLVIDQYGPRVFKLATNEVPRVSNGSVG